MPAREMVTLFKKANLDQSLIDDIPNIISQCQMCRMWERLPPKQVYRKELAQRFNDKLWADIFFSTIFCEGDPRECTNLHLLDEATLVTMLPLLLNRTVTAIKQGFLRWFEPYGVPAEVAADAEKGIRAPEMREWLAENHCKLLPLPPATGSRHTQYGLVDVHSKIIRGVVHRVDQSLVERKVGSTAEELFALVAWASNTTKSRQGYTPYERGFGVIPRDPLNTHLLDNMTTKQMSEEDQVLERIRNRGIALQTFQEETVKQKIARAAKSQKKAAEFDEEVGVAKYEIGDEVETFRDPGNKDISGWRGPGVVVSLGDPTKKDSKESGIRVEWQGHEDWVPVDQVRPFFPGIFWLAPELKSSVMMRIMQEVEGSYQMWGKTPTTLGKIKRNSLEVDARATTTYEKLWKLVQKLAKRAQRPCEGALVGGGVRGFPAATSTPGIMWMVYWEFQRPASLSNIELRSHWGASLVKLVGTVLWRDVGFIAVYATEKKLEETYEDDDEGGGVIEIPDEVVAEYEKDQVPIDDHEEGMWLPSLEVTTEPCGLSPIQEENEETEEEVKDEDEESFHSAMEFHTEEGVFKVGHPEWTSKETGRRATYWSSHGADVFLGQAKTEKLKNNQTLTKEDEKTYHKEVDEAKEKEIRNYCVHSAIRCILASGKEWNILSATWVLTFKIDTTTGKWIVKARLCLRGFQDLQGKDVLKYSPTASRVGQRLLISTSVLRAWELISIDISAAFLQGLPMSTVKTRTGEDRVVWCRPPKDVWTILRRIAREFGLDVPPIGYEGHWLWVLLKAAYGLDDAPLLWRRMLVEFCLDKGWEMSGFDKCILYLRSVRGAGDLLGMLSLHLDDEGATGTKEVLDTFIDQMTAQFGQLKLQRNKFRHIGHDYEQVWHDDGSCTVYDDQIYYTEGISPIEIPKGSKTRKANEAETREWRRLNGEMSYGSGSRPDCIGRISLSQQNVHSETDVSCLEAVNTALENMQNPKRYKRLQFPPLNPHKLKLVLVSDAGLRSRNTKYSQWCFWVLLMETDNLGGPIHILEFRSKRGTRVSKSSMAAEILALCRASESGQRIGAWLSKIWYGSSGAAELLQRPMPIPVVLYTDADDCWLALRCSKPYAGADESLCLYLESLREDLIAHRLEQLAWVPTDQMTVDGGTKLKDDWLADQVMREGGWWPDRYKMLLRTGMEGADYHDRKQADAFDWYFSCECMGTVFLTQGCGDLCRLCNSSDAVHEDDEDWERDPDIYWVMK